MYGMAAGTKVEVTKDQLKTVSNVDKMNVQMLVHKDNTIEISTKAFTVQVNAKNKASIKKINLKETLMLSVMDEQLAQQMTDKLKGQNLEKFKQQFAKRFMTKELQQNCALLRQIYKVESESAVKIQKAQKKTEFTKEKADYLTKLKEKQQSEAKDKK